MTTELKQQAQASPVDVLRKAYQIFDGGKAWGSQCVTTAIFDAHAILTGKFEGREADVNRIALDAFCKVAGITRKKNEIGPIWAWNDARDRDWRDVEEKMLEAIAFAECAQ